MHAMTSKPPLHSLRSFIWNVRKLGFWWWLRCAVVNTWLTLCERFRDP